MVQIIFDAPLKSEKALSLSVTFPFTISVVHLGAQKNKKYRNSITATISTTLFSSLWNYNLDELEKVLFEFALREINSKYLEQLINDNIEIDLHSDNMDKEQPFDTTKIPNPEGYSLVLDDDKLNPKPKMGFWNYLII